MLTEEIPQKSKRQSQALPLRTRLALIATAGLTALAVAFYLSGPPDGNPPAATSGAMTGTNDANSSSASLKPLATGSMAAFLVHDEPREIPEFAFNGPDAKPLSLADYKGKVVLVNLWATWCAPCRAEMPALDQLNAELAGEDFEVVAISVDRGDTAKPLAFLQETGVKSMKFYHDPSAKIYRPLGFVGLPGTFLVDRQGREIGRLAGPAEWHAPTALALIKAAIELKN